MAKTYTAGEVYRRRSITGWGCISPQVEDTFREGQEKSEEEPDRRDIKEENDAIEMSEDFDGKMHDGETRESGVLFPPPLEDSNARHYFCDDITVNL